MTGQEFKAKYQLLKKVSDGRLTTYHALASNGAVVMVHLVEANAAEEHAELLVLIDRLGPADRERVLVIDEVDGTPLIVTRFLLDFRDLREWLEAGARAAVGPDLTRDAFAARSPAPPPTPTPPPESARPDSSARSEPAPASAEFTALFAAPSSPPTPSATEPAAASGAPGEFTRMFRAPAPPAPEAPAPAPADAQEPAEPAAPAVGGTTSGPGEFTKIFGAVSPVEASPQREDSAVSPPVPQPVSQSGPPVPPAETAPPTRPAPVPGKEPGEFTRIFGSPAVPREAPPTELSFAPGPVAPAPKTGPGEFTRVFGPPSRGSETPRESLGDSLRRPPVPQTDDYLSRLGGSPAPSPPPYQPPPAPPATPEPRESANPWNLDLPRPPQPTRPSEFTRVVAAHSRPDAAQLPAGVALPSPVTTGGAPARSPSKKWLIIGLALIAIVAIAAVVILVLVTR